MQTRILALAKHLTCEPDEISETRYDSSTFVVANAEFMVLTDDEADDRARDYTLKSVWAFRPGFLAAHTVGGVDEDVIKAIQDKEHFVQDAIRAYGRAHFLNTYDSEEHEVSVDGEIYYVYRVN